METISQLPAATAVGTDDLMALTQGSTGPGTGNSKSATVAQVLANVPVPRPNGRALLQWTGGAIVANGTYWFVLSVPYAGTLASIDAIAGNGSFVCDVQIGGVSVGGLSSLTVNSPTVTTTTATGPNTFTAGAVITVVISSATSSPTDSILELNLVWS